MRFTFVLGHAEIYRNERDDWLAKNVRKKNINVVNVPKSYLKNILKFEKIKEWNYKYLTTYKADITKKFFPTISEKFKNKNFALVCQATQCMEILEAI